MSSSHFQFLKTLVNHEDSMGIPIHRILVLVALTLSALIAQPLNAQDSQEFVVVVDPVLSISAPDHDTIYHDTNSTDQEFPTAQWTVACNNQQGAVVDFTTTDVFANGNVRRDLRMSLSVTSTDADGIGDVWAVNPALSTFSSFTIFNFPIIRNGRVQAVSSRPGNATLGLDLVFRATNYARLRQGNYTVVVTGTIAAN